MQTRAVIEAAINVNKEGLNVVPEIMIPLIGDIKELQYVKNGYNANCSGDIWLRLMPGWKMGRDVASASNLVRRSSVFFPMIIWGAGVKAHHIDQMTPATVMATELARILRIRRPNDNCLRMFK